MPRRFQGRVFEHAYATAFTGSLVFTWGATAALASRVATEESVLALAVPLAYLHLGFQLLKIYYYLHEIERGQYAYALKTALNLLPHGSPASNAERLARALLAVIIVFATKFTSFSAQGNFLPIPFVLGFLCFGLLLFWDRAVWDGLREVETTPPANPRRLAAAKAFFHPFPGRISLAGSYTCSMKSWERLLGAFGALAALGLLTYRSLLFVIAFVAAAVSFWVLVWFQHQSKTSKQKHYVPLRKQARDLLLNPLAELVAECRSAWPGWSSLCRLLRLEALVSTIRRVDRIVAGLILVVLFGRCPSRR